MVQIIENPYAGSVIDPRGQSIGQALNSISNAFTVSRGAGLRNQLALDKEQRELAREQQQLAAQGTIGDIFGKYADAQQDYLQDAPDYPEPQPPPTIDIDDPAGIGRAFMRMGQKPGEALQTLSALQGGPKAPGVVLGAIPGDAVARTPEYLDRDAARESQKLQLGEQKLDWETSKLRDVSPGATLYNPATGEAVFTAPVQQKQPQLVDVPQPDGTVQKEWVAPGGAAGTPVGAPIPGAAGKAPTEQQANSALFATRMLEADKILNDPGMIAASISPAQAVQGAVPLIGNALVSDQKQAVTQASRDFINAVLRRESGAAINESEFANARQQYLPQPFDRPEVIKQKAKNRATAIKAIELGTGPGYAKQMQGKSAGDASPVRGAQGAPAAQGGIPIGGQTIINGVTIKRLN